MKQPTEKKVKKALSLLKSISHPKRFLIVSYIRDNKEVCQKDIIKLLDVNQPTISHHLTILQKSGIIEYKRKGRFFYFYINEEKFSKVIDMVDLLGK